MATFTALNGGSPKATEGVNGSVDVKRAGSIERPNGPAPPSEPKPIGEVSTSQRERESWPGPTQERPPYPSASYPDIENSHKRKRSDSAEARREHPSQSERPEASRPSQRPSESRDRYGTPQRDYRPYSDEGREQHDSWFSQQSREERDHGYQEPQSAAPNSANTDEQIGETLRRATSQIDHSDYPQTSPDGEDRSMPLYSGQYTPEQRRDGVIQSDPKKRKRNFSNRTKTGCLTCRKRKKKCDENKPECKRSLSPELTKVCILQFCRHQLCSWWLCMRWVPTAAWDMAEARKQADNDPDRIEGSELRSSRCLWNATAKPSISASSEA